LPPDQSSAASVDLSGGKWSTNVLEVWFSGGHGDVGGGCAKNIDKSAASRIPLTWMIREIVLCNTGILFDEDALKRDGISLPSSATGPTILTESKAGAVNTHAGLAEENWVEILDHRYADDVQAATSDQLKKKRAWWLLEVMPFTYRVPIKTKGPDNWRLSPKPNLGKARTIQGKKVKIHVSVQARMQQDGAYLLKARQGDAELEWVH